jgi:hypothetical protein
MRIPVKHPAFKSGHLSVEQASFFSGPKLLLDGVLPVEKKSAGILSSGSAYPCFWYSRAVLLAAS